MGEPLRAISVGLRREGVPDNAVTDKTRGGGQCFRRGLDLDPIGHDLEIKIRLDRLPRNGRLAAGGANRFAVRRVQVPASSSRGACSNWAAGDVDVNRSRARARCP